MGQTQTEQLVTGGDAVVRRSLGRRGILLGPKSIAEGDLIGVRISTEQARTPLPAGRGWTASEAGTAIMVQVPLTVLGG